MQLTIPQAAKLYGKHRSTIHRHIEAGRLSCGFRGDDTRVVEMAELIRCYGEPQRIPQELQPPATQQQDGLQHAMLQALQAMHAELVALRQEVSELKRLPAPNDIEPPMAESDTDPHGLRALARSLRDPNSQK